MKQERIKIPNDWKLVVYKSIYGIQHESEGYLKPNGDVVDYFRGIIPNGWLTLSSKKEVKEIVRFLETPIYLPERPNYLQQATERLLPCPFCGNKAIMCPVGLGQYKAKCTVCTASIIEDRIDKTEGMWNLRHVPGMDPIDL